MDSRRPNLDDDDSAALNRILVANPNATFGRIQNLMFRATGIAISKSTIHRRRKRIEAGKPLDGNSLSNRHKLILARIIKEDDGDTSAPQLATIFGEATGRTIHPVTLARFRRKYFPTIKLKCISERLSYDRAADRRIAAARAEKQRRHQQGG